MRAWILAGLLALAASPAAAESLCAPPTLTKVVTRLVFPVMPAGQWGAEPLVTYRQGALNMRTEEAPDPAQNLHLLIVMAAPDMWMVNRADRTGKHIVDPGPTFDVHAPIVTGPGVAKDFLPLEFGCEAAFARARGKPSGVRKVGGDDAEVHAVTVGAETVEVLLSKAGKPVEIGYYRDGKAVQVIRYDAWEDNLRADATLFARPEGYAMTEERPGR